jgi:hypothetical protein
MITYQVVCTVPEDIEHEWRDWMLEEHIRDVMGTEMFTEYSLQRVVKPHPEQTVQYSIRYRAESWEKIEQYRSDFAPVLQAAHNAKYGSSITVERSILEDVRV